MSATSIAGFLAVIDFVRYQPQPYSALSDYLTSIVVLPRWKDGVEVLPFSTIILNLILLCTAIATCFIKIRCKTFHLGYINKDYILRPNSAVCFALGCIVYSLLSVAETAVWISGNDVKGIDNTRGRVALAGIKFSYLWIGAWCFSWSSAGHYICCKWRPPWQPAHSHSKIPVTVVWVLNTTFIAAALVALIFPLITFTMMELEARDLLDSVTLACKKLQRLDAHQAVKFDLATAMPILSPLFQALPKLFHVVKLLQMGIAAWFCVLCLVISAQLIFICLAFLQRRVMGANDSLWATIVRVVNYKANIDLDSGPKSTLDHAREKNVIMMISLIILVSGVAFLPVVIWQYRTATIEHIAGVTGQLLTDLISSFIVSVIANVLMIAIVLQAIRLLNSKHRRPGNQVVATSEDFPMRFSSYISAESPQENKAYPDGILSMGDPNDTAVTDYDKWHKDNVSIHLNPSDALSEIPADERRPSVV